MITPDSRGFFMFQTKIEVGVETWEINKEENQHQIHG